MHLDLKTMPQLGLRAPAAAQVLAVSLARLFRTLEQVVFEEAMISLMKQEHEVADEPGDQLLRTWMNQMINLDVFLPLSALLTRIS